MIVNTIIFLSLYYHIIITIFNYHDFIMNVIIIMNYYKYNYHYQH